MLVVENGSLLANANSFVSVEEVRNYALFRTYALSNPDIEIEKACILAMDYLETFRDKFKGAKVDPAVQTLQFPRDGVFVDNYELPSAVIPQVLKLAQCQLVIEVLAGTDLMPSGDGREVIREKVDVLETEYALGAGGSPQPSFHKVLRFLEPLLKTSSVSLTSERI